MTQQENSLAYGPNPILFQVEDLISHVLVPMNKEDGVKLELLFSIPFP